MACVFLVIIKEADCIIIRKPKKKKKLIIQYIQSALLHGGLMKQIKLNENIILYYERHGGHATP